MNSVNDTNLAQQGHDFANRAADKAKDGIDKVASTLSDTVESARQRSKPIIDQVGAAASKVRDSAVEASDSLITYTKNNPIKALMMAAAAGALFLTVIKAFTPSRD
jgi:ElaB/YqjD/DUF883 family membrane-anchored ribosome-binding protein